MSPISNLPRAAAVVAAVFVLAAPLSAQTPSFGPLTYEEGGPLHRISFSPMTEGVEPVAKGRWSSDLWMGYSSIFEQDSAATHEVFFDMERLATTLTVRRGITDRLEVGGRLRFVTTGGGLLDSFIVWWHDRLGLGNANRDRYPYFEYRYSLDGPVHQELIELERRAFDLDDLRLHAKWLVHRSEDGRSALSARVVARFPTQRNLFGADKSDLGVVLAGRAAAGAWYVHGSAGIATLRTSLELERIVRSRTGFFMAGVERPLGERIAAIVQYQLGTPVLRGFHDSEVDGLASNLVFGAAGRFGEAWRWEASFQEDLPADTPAIDFTLGLRLSRAW